MIRHCLKTVFASVIFTAACSDPTQPPVEPTEKAVRQLVRFPDCEGPATSVDPAFDVTVPLETYLQNHKLFAALAKEVPGGFAGVFHDREQPVMLLTDPAKAAQAKTALAPYLADLGTFNLALAEIRAARWDFAQLTNWYTYIFRHTPVSESPLVTYSDTDVMVNRILIGVRSAATRQELIAALKGLGLPCDLIALEIR